jgi:AsmA protein
MSPIGRRLLWIAGILLGVLILLVLALPYVVSLDTVRARVIRAAEESLHRKVEIGKMRIQILTGLGAGVENVAVLNGQQWSTRALMSAGRASVKVAFWPLLSRRIEVRKIVLDGATVAIERDPDGKLNIDDFLSAGQRESGPASRTAAAALLVSRIEIDRGRILFVDRKVNPDAPVTVALDDLTGRITDIGPKTPARFDFAARFLADTGRNLSLKGTLGPPLPGQAPIGEAPVQANLSAKLLQLKRLGPYVAAFRDNDPGTLSMEGKAEGELLGALTVTGNLAVDPAGPSSPIPSTDGTFSVTLDRSKGTLAIGRSLFDVASLPLAVEGRVDDFKNTPRVAIHVSTPGEVPIDDVTGFPGLAGRLPENVRLAGKLRLDARIEGSPPDLETTGTVDAAPFNVTMNGEAFFSAGSAQATLGSRGQAPLAGRVTVPSGKLKKLDFEKLVADWTWNKGVLTLVPVAVAFGGKLGGRIESNLAQPKSESHVALDVEGVQAQPLVENLTTLRNVFAGTLNGKLALSTHGLSWDALSKTARGEGHLSVADADLRTVQLMPEVARCLAAVGKIVGFQVPPSLESTKFSKLETSVKLADGKFATPDLVLTSRDVSAKADGWVGLDKTLFYEGQVVLGPPVVKSLGSAGRYIADPQLRLELPFRVTGDVTAPKVVIDEAILLDLGRRALARQAGAQVGGTAGKVLGDVLGGDGKTSSPVDLLQQLLKPPAPTPTPK